MIGQRGTCLLQSWRDIIPPSGVLLFVLSTVQRFVQRLGFRLCYF